MSPGAARVGQAAPGETAYAVWVWVSVIAPAPRVMVPSCEELVAAAYGNCSVIVMVTVLDPLFDATL
jgi:hypothetical protein